MDTHPQTRVSTPRYSRDPKRKCVFSIETFTGGVKGLAYAVLLQAIGDGCDPDWLHEIATAYGIDLPPELLDHIPSRCVRLNLSTGRLMAVDGGEKRGRLILSWEDALSPPKWMRSRDGGSRLRLTA
jgi:hypothetical protein